MVTVIDLDMGNLQSVTHAFRRIGADVTIARTPEAIEKSRIVVLPGVGAFERGMSRLRERGLISVLHAHVRERERPLVGICLGMQLLADRSHEHGVFEGLGLISGEVVRLEQKPPRYRVPNIGWMPVTVCKDSVMFPSDTQGQAFYHVHSYHFVCRDPSDIVATVDFGGKQIVTAIERGHVHGVQFHPEKSQDAGLNLLSRLLDRLQSLESLDRA